MLDFNGRATSSEFNGGSPLSERDIRLRLLDVLGNGRDLCRGMGQLRKDIRWLAMGGIFDEMREKMLRLMDGPEGTQSRITKLPPRTNL